MPAFDKIIRNGTIIDGTGGTPAFHGDIGIKNGKIAMISGRIHGSAKEELDATGCIVAPGAIDANSVTPSYQGMSASHAPFRWQGANWLVGA